MRSYDGRVRTIGLRYGPFAQRLCGMGLTDSGKRKDFEVHDYQESECKVTHQLLQPYAAMARLHMEKPG